MVNITLSVSDELKREMEKFPEVNWSAVFREVIKKRIMILKHVRHFTRDSDFTDEDAVQLGNKINKSLSRRYKR